MFTSCSNCLRQYRIHAEQLMAAGGLVRCGHCGKQFDAIQRLTDKPVPTEVLGAANVKMDVEHQVPAGNVKKEVMNQSPAEFDDDTFADDEPQFDIPGVTDIPDILKEQERKPAGIMSRLFWSFATIILVTTLIMQVSWFNRDDLLRMYPEIRPWARQLCDRFHCELIREYRTSDIKLLNRDVRLHPKYADTLLVNATMANRSQKTQPYPRIQFSLFDTNGKMIASRKFRPEEYLDNSIDIKSGMPVNQPVHFVLEVTGTTDNAVSFEFRFL